MEKNQKHNIIFLKTVDSTVSRKNIFWGKIFFSKWKIFQTLIFFRDVHIFEKRFSKKPEMFSENIFSQKRVMKKLQQKVFGSNFSKNKYFLINPKAYDAA